MCPVLKINGLPSFIASSIVKRERIAHDFSRFVRLGIQHVCYILRPRCLCVRGVGQVLSLVEEKRQLTDAADEFEERLRHESRRAEKRRMSAANRAELEVSLSG